MLQSHWYFSLFSLGYTPMDYRSKAKQYALYHFSHHMVWFTISCSSWFSVAYSKNIRKVLEFIYLVGRKDEQTITFVRTFSTLVPCSKNSVHWIQKLLYCYLRMFSRLVHLARRWRFNVYSNIVQVFDGSIK